MYIDSDLPYPHNIFLEFLLQGGVIYLTFWIILFAKLFKKFKQLLRKDDTNFFLIPISVFPFIQLLASGTYLESGLFWFTIAYVFNYKTINV